MTVVTKHLTRTLWVVRKFNKYMMLLCVTLLSVSTAKSTDILKEIRAKLQPGANLVTIVYYPNTSWLSSVQQTFGDITTQEFTFLEQVLDDMEKSARWAT